GMVLAGTASAHARAHRRRAGARHEVAPGRVERAAVERTFRLRSAVVVWFAVPGRDVGRRDDAALVAVEKAGAADRVQALAARGPAGDRQAIVGVTRRALAGAGRPPLGRVLEDDAREQSRARYGRPPVGPDGQHPLTAPVGPVVAAVHLAGAGAVAEATPADGVGQSDGLEARTVRALDPDGDLRAGGGNEAKGDAARDRLRVRDARPGETGDKRGERDARAHQHADSSPSSSKSFCPNIARIAARARPD